MRVYRNLAEEIVSGSVATVGIFDGVHKAHQHIVERLKELSTESNCENLLVTFWPHPRYVLNKDAEELKLLNTLDEKLQLLHDYGVDNVLLIPFDMRFATLSFDAFVKRILVDKLRIRQLLVGFNHKFGRNRQGNYDNLKNLAEKESFRLEQVPIVEVENIKVSSSEIRRLLAIGNTELAEQMLGYNYTLTGTIVHGNKLGRHLGFPTANIELAELYKLVPSQGVYAIEANIGNKTVQGMLNIGIRPTIDSKGLRVIEANFFNFNDEIYNQQIKVRFFKQIREEKKFDNIEQLKKQINVDKLEIQKYFSTKK